MATTTTDAKKAAKKAKKTKTGKVHVIVLMDESGSMRWKEEAVITGCNEFIEAFGDADEARAWLAWFDKTPGEDIVRMKVAGKKMSKVAKLTAGDYVPRGGTPLNDAILHVIGEVDAKIDKGDGVFMAIITDGFENSSEVKDPAVVKDALAKFEKRGWAFTYIGAGQDSVANAAMMGMAAQGQSFNTSNTPDGFKKSIKSAGRFARNYSVGYVAEGGDAPAALRSNLIARSEAFEKTGGDIEKDDEE